LSTIQFDGDDDSGIDSEYELGNDLGLTRDAFSTFFLDTIQIKKILSHQFVLYCSGLPQKISGCTDCGHLIGSAM